MFSYYGSKANIIDHYPKPKFGKIIEPFAGSARYSLKYWENDILLVDKYQVIVNVWHWLQKCSKQDVRTLPIPNENQTTHDLLYDCEDAKNFVGFVIGYGCFSQARKTSKHYLIKRTNGIKFQLNRIANDLEKIRHWEIVSGTYESINNQHATWFIDPPYQFGGHKYVESNLNIDFNHLRNWTVKRQGQVIVCETTKANWMNFKPMISQKTKHGKNTEAIWTNQRTCFDNLQQSLF